MLKLTPRDVEARKLTFRDAKSGEETEVVFIPQKIADRLKEYIEQKKIGPDERSFPLIYQGARAIVMKAGNLAGVHLRPRDLRRHAATQTSRSGAPIDIVWEHQGADIGILISCPLSVPNHSLYQYINIRP